jgi:hypothetical protein
MSQALSEFAEPRAPKRVAQQGAAADTKQFAVSDLWYRSGGKRRAATLAVSAVGRS